MKGRLLLMAVHKGPRMRVDTLSALHYLNSSTAPYQGTRNRLQKCQCGYANFTRPQTSSNACLPTIGSLQICIEAIASCSSSLPYLHNFNAPPIATCRDERYKSNQTQEKWLYSDCTEQVFLQHFFAPKISTDKELIQDAEFVGCLSSESDATRLAIHNYR